MNDKEIKIIIKEYLPKYPNSEIKFLIRVYSNHFLPSIKPHTIFYNNVKINDENKYKKIIEIIESNINRIKELDNENSNSSKGGLQEEINIQFNQDNYTIFGNTDNHKMKQLYKDIKENIVNIIET